MTIELSERILRLQIYKVWIRPPDKIHQILCSPGYLFSFFRFFLDSSSDSYLLVLTGLWSVKLHPNHRSEFHFDKDPLLGLFVLGSTYWLRVIWSIMLWLLQIIADSMFCFRHYVVINSRLEGGSLACMQDKYFMSQLVNTESFQCANSVMNVFRLVIRTR